MKLKEFFATNSYVMVFAASVACPTGKTEPAGYPDMDWVSLRQIGDLTGIIDDLGRWQWCGYGDPTDECGSSILTLTAYVDRTAWVAAVNDYLES